MPTRTAVPRRAMPAVVGVLSVAWLATLGVLVLRYLKLGLSGWSLSYAGTAQAALDQRELDRQAVVVVWWLAGAAVGGAVLLALVAYAGRLRRSGRGFLIAALVLGILAIPLLAVFGRPDPVRHPHPPTPTQCVERSGGDTRCPGG